MENESPAKSKTQIKKEATELQRLGEELILLSRQQLERMDLPERLRTALIEAQSITSNIAGKRQRQFIGTLMREVDPEPIRCALQQIDTALPIESETGQEAQMWLDRLLAGDQDSVEAFLAACPGLERQRLGQILRNIKKEHSAGSASKSLKGLEKLIMECMEERSL